MKIIKIIYQLKSIFSVGLLFLLLVCCDNNKFTYDASGTFEATELIISSEASGKLEIFNLHESDELSREQYIGYVDSTQLFLKKLQLQATQSALKVSRPNIVIQISAIKEQIKKTELDKKRIESLFRLNGTTQKQVDDINSKLIVLKNSLNAKVNSLSTSINGLNNKSLSIEFQISQIEDQIKKCKIINPINGTVLAKYAEAKELVSYGKPLYKIANTKKLFLRAYIVSKQLEKIKLGQDVTVFTNWGNAEKSYHGKVVWISDKAEFTPKTIQTKDERQNLVYAVKIIVENTEGYIKIGMYGNIRFSQ